MLIAPDPTVDVLALDQSREYLPEADENRVNIVPDNVCARDAVGIDVDGGLVFANEERAASSASWTAPLLHLSGTASAYCS